MNELVFLDPDDLNEIPFTTSKVTPIHGKGHVYIIEADGLIKIGMTKHIEARINALRTQSGRKFTKVCFTKQCNNYREIESSMHKTFKEERRTGEWFGTKFEEASKTLATYDLDFSDVKENDFDPVGFFKKIDDAFKQRELQEITDSNPMFKGYLKRNGFRLYFCERENDVRVTDDADVDLSLELFLTIYESNCG